VAATESAGFYAQHNPYRRFHDIVLIDERGTGKSDPLNCRSLQYKAGLQAVYRYVSRRSSEKMCLSNEECFDKIVVEFVNDSGKSILNTTCVQSMQPQAYKTME